MITAEEVAGTIVLAMKRIAPFKDHNHEAEVMVLLRDAIQADRQAHCLYVARGATPLLSQEEQTQRSNAHG